uniref:Thioredoxin domain-containing protein 3 n=1 Tax=Otolemur garnettii TaxID=30611 RepID=H0WSK7_OTOGA
MAGKKREVQLQTVINNQSLWDEMLQNKGLTVIDVYQGWCGPCKAIQALFRKLRNELNEEEILHFVVAEADNIVSLQPFRDKCEPVFLFSLNGKIIAKIQGANAPLISKKVTSLINDEKKIAAGEMVRPQYHEILLVDTESADAGEGLSEGAQEQYSIAIIKPDAVLTRKVSEIKEKITKAGFIIEAEDKKVFTEDQVMDFYSHIADQPDFEEFMSFMTSGLSYILVVSQGSEQEPPKEVTEPEPDTEATEPTKDQSKPEVDITSEEFKKKKRDSLQEILERQNISQFCDVEDDATLVTKFLDTFFPDFKTLKSMKLQKTVALLRPDLFQERKEEVLDIIGDEGFKILEQRQIVLSKGEARTLCKAYEDEEYFEKIIENMTSGPSLALILLRDKAVQHWKELLGPGTVEEANTNFPMSLCAKFAMESLPINQLYGSDSLETAERDMQQFFPLESTLALIKPHATEEQQEEILRIIQEAGFDITQHKKILLTPELASVIYFKITGKDFYDDVLQVLSEGPSVVLALTKWNAVSAWRHLMGPTDPEEARMLAPDTIRARFGISVSKNIVHGSSNTYEATEVIGKIFEEFVPDNSEEN